MSEALAVELGEAVSGRLAALGCELRAAGVRVGVGELLGAHRALDAVDAASRADAYFALRATLCARREDREPFDQAFAAVFGAGRAAAAPPVALPDAASLVMPRVGIPAAAPDGDRDPPAGAEPVPAAWSDVELLRDKDFADYTDAERALAQTLVRRLAARGPMRPSRRTRPVRRRGERPDLRRTVRASLRTGGEPIERRWREPCPRPRPLLLVCDVSGSMAPYARMLLQYVQACVAVRRRVEAFAFGTRLTRITRELAGRDPDRALARAADAVVDWSGGTRIGAALATLNREHGRRLARSSVAVIASDGWDRGDPDLLAREMARLRRCTHRTIWLNPLKAHPGYEPLTRGMRAALPSVDHFLAGESIGSLARLAALLEGGI